MYFGEVVSLPYILRHPRIIQPKKYDWVCVENSIRIRLISLELNRHMKCSLQVFHILCRRIARLSPSRPSPRQLAVHMGLEKNRGSVEQTEHHAVEDEQEVRRKPCFGMTGTQLNIWMTVACTTAMTLFGGPVASSCLQS